MRSDSAGITRNSYSDIADEVLIRLWQQFYAEYPTEESCLNELYARSRARVDACMYCGATDVQMTHEYRVLKCRRCKSRIWLTAGTFFGRIRVPRAWLGAIWLMEKGVIISACRFHKLADIAYASAFAMFKKIAYVIENEMSHSDVTSPELFKSIFFKRSRETAARAHPMDEEGVVPIGKLGGIFSSQTVADNQADRKQCLVGLRAGDFSAIALKKQGDTSSDLSLLLDQLTDSERIVYGALSDQPVQVEGLLGITMLEVGALNAALMMLEVSGLATRAVGDWYVRQAVTDQPSRAIEQPDERTMDTVWAVIEMVRTKFQGISRKYLQSFVALYWVYTDKARWQNGQLLQACAQFRQIKYRDIIEAVSPATIKLLPFGEMQA